MAPQEDAPSAPGGAGTPHEALSNEVLKLKVDDLFQEVENVKRRLERLERQSGRPAGGQPNAPSTDAGIVSDPDRA